MKNVKMSLANIQGKLSRKELKEVMAGSGFGGTCYSKQCSEFAGCILISSCTGSWGLPWGGNYYCRSVWTHGGEIPGGACSKAWA